MLNREHHPRRQRGWHWPALGLVASALLGACSPALNWRESRPKDIDILLTFPCKPQQIAQTVQLAGSMVKMSMTGCATSDMTFALAHADMKNPAQVSAALAALHQAAVRNVAGSVTHSQPAQVAHATGGLPDALDLQIDGKSPTGEPLRERVLLFAQGTQVFQATTFAQTSHFKGEAAQTFSNSIRLPGGG
jgi:hypothetical protein